MNLIWVIPAKGAAIQYISLSERDAVARIRSLAGLRPGTALGIGDDAALLDIPGRAAVCHDILVEGVHFRRATATMRDVGHKAVAVNLSDLAAMGATPVAILVGVTVPAGGLDDEEWSELYGGMEDLAAAHGATLAGGDTTVGPALVLAVTAVGGLDGILPLTRAGALPGDVLCVTGPLGAAAAGLRLLEGECAADVTEHADALVAAQRRPVPRVADGRILAGAAAHAGMDISDGLLLDATRLAAESGLRAHVALDDVPLAPGVDRVAAAVGADARELAATGGEDYELLVAVPPRRVEAVSATLPRPLVPCGHLEAGDGLRVTRDGRSWTPAHLGWEAG